MQLEEKRKLYKNIFENDRSVVIRNDLDGFITKLLAVESLDEKAITAKLAEQALIEKVEIEEKIAKAQALIEELTPKLAILNEVK